MSYHKVNQGNENGTNGTTHIAQLHAVPAYTCLIEEVNSVKMKRAKKSIPVAQDAYSSSHFDEGVKEGGHCTKSFIDPSLDNAKKQSSNNGGKAKNRSDSIDLFYDACEISNESNGTRHVKVSPSETMAGNLDNHNVDSLRSMETTCQASKSGTYEGATGADSPSYLDDMVDSNSAAAASVAALRKAIEEAQVRIKVAKESMRRKKEGFPDRVKRKSNIDRKAGETKEAKLAYKTMKLEEKINTRQTFGEMDALPQVSSELGKPMMKIEQVRSDLGAKEMCVAKEAVQEAQKKLKSSEAEHKEEVELKEAGHKGKALELKEEANTKKVPYIKNTGRDASEKPEESDHTTEMVKEYWERKDDEGKVRADNEAGVCEELAHETKHMCQEVVDETKLIQETLDNGMIDKKLKVIEDGEVENKATPFHQQNDCESNLGEQGLMIGNNEKVGCKPEDGMKVEGSIELEECQQNLRAIQELAKGEKNISQEQKGSEDKVEVFSELEEFELTEFLEPKDNKRACNPHRSDLISMEKEVDNLVGCSEDRKRRNEYSFLDLNQEIEYSFQREVTDDMFSDIYVQEILEDIVDHVHDDEEIFERNTEDSELEGNGRVQDAQAGEHELKGDTHLMEENERERKDNKVLEVIMETQTNPNYEEIKAKEPESATEPSSSHKPDETEKLDKTQVADTIIENDDTIEVTPEVYASCDVQDDIMVASIASIQDQEKYEAPESVQEMNDFCEKHAGETSAFDQGAVEINETVNQMKNTFEAVTFEDAATSIGETDMKVRQNQDQCLEKAESDCNPEMLVEETTPESVEICKDVKEARVASSDEEIGESQSNSFSEEILSDNEHNIEATQMPSMSEWISRSFKEKEVKSIHSNLKESHQASMTMEEKEVNGKPQKVELDKELLKKIDEAKEREREREREKEKLAVERAIREARERAFADARERAALERAATEARQKNISEGRERLGKTTSLANEKTPAEKAAMEAKLKAERAAVERATAEARVRALERALSEKAASDARNKSDKSVAEKCLGGSKDNGMKQKFHSKSFSYGGK